MKHIHTKNDSFYEIRPALLIAIGMAGLSNQIFSSQFPTLVHLGQACSLVLFISAGFIIKWRRDYRKTQM